MSPPNLRPLSTTATAFPGSADAKRTDPIRTYHHREFPVDQLARLKGSTSISVAIPARNEAATIGDIVAEIRAQLVDGAPLVDELVVLDDESTDRTGAVAAAAGATVARTTDVLAEQGRRRGKGEVLWKSLAATTGDIVVWCDADLVDFDVRFITGILGPMLTDPDVWFTKGFYDRSTDGIGGGGRVTELVARPLLSTFFPELALFRQPLSGEYGGRRSYLERVPFATGYGVEVGLLIDLSKRFGLTGMAQVDLDRRRHRNRPLDDLGPMATAVSNAILRRVDPALVDPFTAELRRNDGELVIIDVSERPPHRVDTPDFLAKHPASA